MHTKDKIIRQFGITSKYKGYRYLLDAIHIAAENYDECLKVTKDVYPVIAHKYGVTKVSVERDIRTVIEKCWDNNKTYLQELSGYKLSRSPKILLAKINALLRRAASVHPQDILSAGDIVLQLSSHTVTVSGTETVYSKT